MIVDVLQENLHKALTRTGRIISSKPQLPIASTILIQTTNNSLLLASTNLESTELVTIGAKVKEEGGICVPAKLLSELVSTLPTDTITLEVKDSALNIGCGRTKATIPGIAASEFPPVSIVEPKETMKFDKEVVCKALSRVLFAAATDETRPLLTGVKVKKIDRELVLAATDGYRLSVARLEIASSGELDIVLPARALTEVVRVANEEKEVKEFFLAKADTGQVVFGVGDTQIRTRLIDGEYPNYEKVIPASSTTKARLDREVFTRAVRSAAIFARDNANIIRVAIEGSDVSVSANTPQVGENTVVVEGKVEGDGGSIAFNSRFLLEYLGNLTSDELILEMTGSLNPGVFRPVGDDSYLHVIMPVRVQV